MPTQMNEIIYTCTGCNATDTIRLFPHEPVPPTINCWKCKAGSGKSTEESMVTHQGMFPPADALPQIVGGGRKARN